VGPLDRRAPRGRRRARRRGARRLAGVAPLVLAIGSEGHGLSAPLVAALDRRVTIPVSPNVESLNAAVATGILLYALSPKTSAEKR
jgi:rRNA methylases